MTMTNLEFVEKMRARDKRVAGRNRLRLKKARRRMNNKAKRRNR